jgi:exodeoxyribonuclease V gamma subunit
MCLQHKTDCKSTALFAIIVNMLKKPPTLFLSHRLDSLLDLLLLQLEKNPISPMQMRTILVPNMEVKQWLFLEIAKRKKIAMGLKILEVGQFFQRGPNPLQMFCLIYQALLHSEDTDLKKFLGGKSKRLLDLTEQLVSFFYTYGEFGKELFSSPALDWQQAILQKIFVEGPWRLAVQQEIGPLEEILCFGIDYLAPVYWEALFKASDLSIYLFSPCMHFWEDLSTNKERKSLRRYWKKQKVSYQSYASLDAYLREAPLNLANWGKLGRETLKFLDRFIFQAEELYPFLEPESLLKQVQFHLLNFEEKKADQKDETIKIFMTGSSRLKEMECVRDEILRLGVEFHEISVLAPNIEPYVPLIEFVFADLIPYRISGFDIAPQSSFRQGLVRFFQLILGRWEWEEVLTLFETPSFYKKQKWDEQKLELFRFFILEAQIQWGIDEEHCRQVLQKTLGVKDVTSQGSWEKGLDRLLDSVVYFRSLQVNPDDLEDLVEILEALKKVSLTQERTLLLWADELEKIAEEFFLVDANEIDQETYQSFLQFLRKLRTSAIEGLFPFEVVQKLMMQSCFGQIHASHLHAVRFSSIEKCSQIPTKVLFLIGMDEESFPKKNQTSSLDLLRRQKIAIPTIVDRDRYLFLQAIFSAVDFLRISYLHLSPDEGKPVGPSLLVQELMGAIEHDITALYCPLPSLYSSLEKETFSWPSLEKKELPKGEVTIHIADLRQLARHPWRFYLQKVLGIYLNEALEDSFALQKGQLIRSTLQKPVEEVLSHASLPRGALGEALKLEIEEKAAEWQEMLAEWKLEPFSLILRENCTAKKWEEKNCIVPPIELYWDGLKVNLVGEIKLVTQKGLLCANEDNIAGLLKVWPEALVTALSLEAPQVLMLKNGKIKELQEAEKDLKAFVEYYFCCLKAPSPLLADWADPILRKGVAELEKKMEKGSSFEDPLIEWVAARVDLKPAAIFAEWAPYLKETFSSLQALYPTRGKSHAAV